MTVTPSLMLDGGEAYKTALILLAPVKAALLPHEMVALIQLIRNTPVAEVNRALANVERPNALAVTAGLMTRHGEKGGMSEAQAIMATACRYIDTGFVMPTQALIWTPGYVQKFMRFTGSDTLKKGWENLGDMFKGIALATTKEYSVDNPPSPLGGEQAPGYRKGLFDALTTNIEPADE